MEKKHTDKFLIRISRQHLSFKCLRVTHSWHEAQRKNLCSSICECKHRRTHEHVEHGRGK